MEAVRTCRPSARSLGSGQVLQEPYEPEKAALVLREMADSLAMDLVAGHLLTDKITVTVGFDAENLKDPVRRASYRGEVVTDAYGRELPKHAHGTRNLGLFTSSSRLIVAAVAELSEQLLASGLSVRRLEASDEALALVEAREHLLGHRERKRAVDAPILGQIA